MLWQQQPVFSCPFEQDKLLVIQTEVYAYWCLYNICAGYNLIDSSKPLLQIPQAFTVNSVVVIGAGIVGAATTHAPALRNIPVIVIEQNEIASAGSGNHHGLLYA